jgi:hypothetical protein
MPAQTRQGGRRRDRRLKRETAERSQEQVFRREPTACEGCEALIARTGCRLCRNCVAEQHPHQEDALLVCQGCPDLRADESIIRWSCGDNPMARWILENFEFIRGKPSSNSASPCLQLVGWKGSSLNVDEERTLSGISTPHACIHRFPDL